MSWLNWAGKDAKSFTEGKRAAGVIVEQDREPSVEERPTREVSNKLSKAIRENTSAAVQIRTIKTSDPAAEAVIKRMDNGIFEAQRMLVEIRDGLDDLADGGDPKNIVLRVIP